MFKVPKEDEQVTRGFGKQQAIDTAVQVFISAITIDPGIQSLKDVQY